MPITWSKYFNVGTGRWQGLKNDERFDGVVYLEPNNNVARMDGRFTVEELRGVALMLENACEAWELERVKKENKT